MIDPTLQNNYLSAMQIDTWLPRTPLPFAKQSQIIGLTQSIEDKQNPLSIYIEEKEAALFVTAEKEQFSQEAQLIKETQQSTFTPEFFLQLMQTEHCLLLIERPSATALQVKDPAYQLLRNILYAAQLPNSPQPLGEIIQWPLFKQSTIAQGKKEAQEFLQSFIITYKEQFTNIRCLWLVGLSSIRYTIDLNETDYFDTPIIEPYGQILLSPSLDKLIETPQLKAGLWQTIRKLIPLWQK